MKVPLFIQSYYKQGEALVQENKGGEIVFSEGTYQVEVLEGEKSFWPFLQMDDQGEIKDHFCSCHTSEKTGGCAHLAAGYLLIFHKTEEPLHVRFRKSFWNVLCNIASERHGYDPKLVLDEGEGKYLVSSQTKKKMVFLEGTMEEGKKTLHQILRQRVLETEETSLKFSNLSVEELSRWKEGRASHHLRYELSFWSDLAKWLLFLQEKGEKYSIDFSYHEEGLPNRAFIRFPQIYLEFYLSRANLPRIIPSLEGVNSSLEVIETKVEGVEKIVYEEDKQCFLLSTKKVEKQKELKGVMVGSWVYKEKKGFYRRRDDPLFSQGVIPKEKIGEALSAYPEIFSEHLEVGVQKEALPIHYFLSFDKEGNLSIESYLFTRGDMANPKAGVFFPWVYLPGKGFYRVEECRFREKKKKIMHEHMVEFIEKNHVWLNEFPGFHIHFTHLEGQLKYHLTKEEELVFQAEFSFPEALEGVFDFGLWVYVKGIGFYRKQEGREVFSLLSGLVVKKQEISHFIDKHEEELEQVENFFISISPVEKMGLRVELEKEEIVVSPQIEYVEGVNPSALHFFGSYIYVEKKGFYRLTSSFQLPKGYEEKTVIPSGKESYFLHYELYNLRPYLLFVDPRLVPPEKLKLHVKKLSKEKKYWLVDLVYESSKGQVGLVKIWEALLEKKKHFFSPVGALNLKEPHFQWLAHLPRKRKGREENSLRLTTLEWIKLCIFEEVTPPKGNSSSANATRKFLKQLEDLETEELLDLSYLQATLRPYQKTGVQWLWFLYCHGLSGLLSDEMGLGKTHQAMALLAGVSHGDPEASCKYMVVCPTSVIYHWEELLKKFLPHLRVHVYHGVSRSLEEFEKGADLLLTSYGILRTGRDDLRSLSFEVVVLDEVQVAKNSSSQTHQALREIQAKMKLGLTGTPIENRLLELWSLFSLVLPSYLPSEGAFRSQFVHPIEKEQDEERRALLTRLIKPFILRRKKGEVLLDLPEKIEEIAYCDLSIEQKELYKQTVLASKEELTYQLTQEDQPLPYIHIFSFLSRLKQVCDHPSLIHKDVENYRKYPCGKWDLFTELLAEALESGQKIVIFSQYLDMLKIITLHLEEKKIGFALVTGATRKRSEEILRFRKDPDCRVFVASLLAAGVGIDLSVASIVIHYDRWWNPAKENQATDRVHRIGQNRGVQVFKLVSKHTIEEDIHQMIEKKKHLIEKTVGRDDQEILKKLSREEMLAILKKSQEVE